VFRLSYHSELGGMFNIVSQGEELLALVVEDFGIGCNHCLLQVKTTVSLSLNKPPCHLFLHLLSSYHKSTQACLLLP
jgi:hypothetical protein